MSTLESRLCSWTTSASPQVENPLLFFVLLCENMKMFVTRWQSRISVGTTFAITTAHLDIGEGCRRWNRGFVLGRRGKRRKSKSAACLRSIMQKYENMSRDVVTKPQRWCGANLVIYADQTCAVFDSHGTLMKGVDSTEQRTTRRNADSCDATLLQRENLRKVDFFLCTAY